MSKLLSSLPVGALVKDTETTIYGKPIVWKLADKNHAGYPANSVTLVSNNIIKLLPFDAIEASNSDSNRKNYGNNRYLFSNLLQWLNKEGTNWYTAMHSADAAPTMANVSFNPYDTTAGFLTNVSAQMKAAVLDTTVTVAKAAVDGGGSESVTSKIFLLSKAEVGFGNENGIAEGSLLAMFSDAASRIAYPTAEAVADSTYTNASLNVSSPWQYWLRSPYFAGRSDHVRIVIAAGSELSYAAYGGHNGLRPALNLPSSILVSDTAGSDGVYTIVWNQAPTKPPSISVPQSIMSGQTADISWTASTDPEGNAITYHLECSINRGSYSRIYTGANLSYVHTITTAMNTLQYRVRAADTAGATSDYTTGVEVNVIHAVKPGISGQDTNLGSVTEPVSVSFVVTDDDPGDSVTVDIKLDGNTIEQIDPVDLGETYNITLTEAQFYGLANGQHKLEITAADSYGLSTTRTFTFSRTVTAIDFELEPIQTDEMPEKILISSQFYAEAITILVCNNALDAAPTWESATNGLKHIFSNTTKTAENWAIGVRVMITPSANFPEVYCHALNGSYI